MVLLGMAGAAGVAPGVSGGERKQVRPAMIIDVNRCIGCHSCVIACKEQNRTPQGCFNTRIRTKNHGAFPYAWQSFTPDLCHQCESAPCVAACKEEATYKLESGIVVVDWQRCTGDGACVKACPHDARFLDTQNGNRADKCDFCVARIEHGFKPACVESCPSGARIFGDRANPAGEFGEHLAIIRREGPGALSGAGTRLFYTTARKS